MMKRRNIVITLGAILCTPGTLNAGPDLICSEITSATSWGFADGKVAYSFGTTLCNIGDEPVQYDSDTNQHPLISQSIYRLKDHRIEQIGIGFVRHTNIPLSGNACGLGCSPGGLDELGVGCSDTNSSTVNGAQALMSPRTEINAFSSDYPYPPTSLGQTGDAIYKRVQVELVDVSDPAALYFVETQIIVPSETSAEARNNNVSYRQVQFSPATAIATLVGPTYDQQPAIYAWRDHANGIGMPDFQILITEADIPGSTERFVLGSRAVELGTDHWRYEYAVFNMNGERGISQIDLGLQPSDCLEILSTEFQAPSYHDDLDDAISSSPWVLRAGESILETDLYDTNPLANAVRWGTTYRLAYELQTNASPAQFGVLIGFFGPNEPTLPMNDYDAFRPDFGEPFCGADLNGDGQVNFFDVSLFLADFNSGGDYNGDGQTNFFDVSAFVSDYQACSDFPC